MYPEEQEGIEWESVEVTTMDRLRAAGLVLLAPLGAVAGGVILLVLLIGLNWVVTSPFWWVLPMVPSLCHLHVLLVRSGVCSRQPSSCRPASAF